MKQGGKSALVLFAGLVLQASSGSHGFAFPLDVDGRLPNAAGLAHPAPIPARTFELAHADTEIHERDGDALGEAARAALERGLAWLAKNQAKAADGALDCSGSAQAAPVAVTALAALAWMAGGNTPERGTNGRELARAIDWLVARTDLGSVELPSGYISLSGDLISRMHGHGFATLALAQAWCMSPSTARGAQIHRALSAAIDCIQRSQSVEGGWWYGPEKGLNHEGSITVTELQALRAAKNAGLAVDKLCIERAVDYVARSQKKDGSFRYALGDEHSSVALTAAAIATLNAAGKYEGKGIQEGYDWIARELAARDASGFAKILGGGESGDGKHVSCAWYERLYLAQAFWQAPDRRLFTSWWEKEVPRVLAQQDKDGSWNDPRFGQAYATAVNCLVLALPEGLLPIFQR